jgi:hypothetical protein
VLGKHCVGVQESRQALALVDEHLAFTEKCAVIDRTVTAAETLGLAKERMRKITKAKS